MEINDVINIIKIKNIEIDDDDEDEEEEEIKSSSNDNKINNNINNKNNFKKKNYKFNKKNYLTITNSKYMKESQLKKNKNIFKKDYNPFNEEKSFPLPHNNSILKKKFKIIPISVNCINLKKKPDNKRNIFEKSIFSKISEAMYQHDKNKEKYPNKKVINLEQINEDNYNYLTKEKYLISIINNKNNEKKKIISEFLERKKKEETSKKIGIENNSDIIFDALKDLKRSNTLTDRNRSFKSSRTFIEFLRDQKLKEKEHKNHLKKEEKLKKKKMNLIIRDRPYLNEESLKIVNNIDRNKENIHMRLYQEYSEKKKRDEIIQKQRLYLIRSKEKKMTQKKIEENSNRLFNEYKNKNNKNDDIIYKKLNKNKTMNFSVSKNSNEIIFKKLIKKIDNSLDTLYGKKLGDDFEINYYSFLELLYTIGFIHKNYYELIKNIDKNKDNEFSNEKEQSLGMKYYSSKEFKNINLLKFNERLISKYKNYKSINIDNKVKKENNQIKSENRLKSYFNSDIEYKLTKEAWKIITKNKEFNKEAFGELNIIFFFF